MSPFQKTREYAERFEEIRALTRKLCGPLSAEDCSAQSMPEASPAKWHLAHTTWFFETFFLEKVMPGYRPYHPNYGFLFNSYYDALGDRHCRSRRGMLTRPSLEDIFRYRDHVEERISAYLESVEAEDWHRMQPILALGLHHEQQHQELLLTDIKHLFSLNPLRPAYASGSRPTEWEGSGKRNISQATEPPSWIEFPEGLRWIGHTGNEFAFENEFPRHRSFVAPFKIASRTVTNGEFLAFIEEGGYRRPEFWLADGFDTARMENWSAPLYWENGEDHSSIMTLGGMRELDLSEAVCHLSYYESDAYARWAGKRLPTEAEWETAALATETDPNAEEDNFLENGRLHPVGRRREHTSCSRFFGDVWEWTASSYSAYPGFRPVAGALGEYNGKFMSGQMVLRGGSCVTPRAHIRVTYRNFFPPESRWQFSGLRLAEDA